MLFVLQFAGISEDKKKGDIKKKRDRNSGKEDNIFYQEKRINVSGFVAIKKILCIEVQSSNNSSIDKTFFCQEKKRSRRGLERQ